MASLSRQTDGYRVQFYDHQKKKRAIWIGNYSQKMAETVKRHVEELIDAAKLSVNPSPETVKWATGVDERIRDKLVEFGLMGDEITQKVKSSKIVAKAYMEKFVRDKEGVSPKWRINTNQAITWFFKYFEDDRLLNSITEDDCHNWDEWMRPKLALVTRGQHVKRVKQILKSAVRKKLIQVNPLDGIKSSTQVDESKNLLIDAADIELIIAETPDLEWAAIIALARYGGLRCPSEVLKLRWSDINWEKSRFLIHSPKTSRYGKETRWFPITPGLMKHLQPLHDSVLPGVQCSIDEFVITKHRSAEKNMRTQLGRFIKRAGLPEIPKPFINFRASARFDFEQAKLFTSDELNAWFGHCEAVARKHYGRLSDVSYNKASRLSYVSTFVSTSDSMEPQGEPENAKTQGNSQVCNAPEDDEYTRRGSNSQPSVPKATFGLNSHRIF